MVGIIKEIYTQDKNGKGCYLLDIYGKDEIINTTIKDAFVGMEVELAYMDNNVLIGVTPTNKSKGMRQFLIDNISGFGPAKAEKATWETYTYIKKANTDKLCEQFGIKSEKAEEIVSLANNQKDVLEMYLITNGACTKNKIEKILAFYGSRAVNILRNNPYKLTEMNGFGFLEADKIACATGIAKNSKERLSSAIQYILFSAAFQEGHCYLKNEQLQERLFDTLTNPPKKAGKAKEKACMNAIKDWGTKKNDFIKKYKPSDDEIMLLEGIYQQRLGIKKSFIEAHNYGVANNLFVFEKDRYYLSNIYEKEINAVALLKEYLTTPNFVKFTVNDMEMAIKEVEKRKTELLKAEGKNPFLTTEEQKSAVKLALLYPLCIISGGPGRGKTAIAEIIAQAYKNKFGEDAVLMMAPTGRAAQRATESTGFPASTIHRAISTKKVQGKLIIVDESSKIDIFLFESFLKWAKGNNIVFLGDVNQIASIGPGQVLKNMMDSKKIPFIMLMQGHRNGGSIAKNSDKINEGKPVWTYKFDKNFIYIPTAREVITKTFLHYFFEEVKQFGINNVLAITPSREGVLSVNLLNKRIQQEYCSRNEGVKITEDLSLYLGDRVMQTKNVSDFTLIDKNGATVKGIFNGERGTVVKILKNDLGEKIGLVVLFDDGKKGAYRLETAKQLTLSYVMTIHKCQGSEAESVMLGMTFQDAFLINRNLFYTGETRAKKKITLIGEQKKAKYGNKMMSSFDLAVYKTNDNKRQTSLAEKLAG